MTAAETARMAATETALIVTAPAVRMMTMMTELYGNETGTLDEFRIRKDDLELVFYFN